MGTFAGGLRAVAALGLALCAACAAAADERLARTAVLVAPPVFDAPLGAVADGYAAWLHHALRTAGLEPLEEPALAASRPGTEAGEQTPGAPRLPALLEAAARQGASRALLARLRLREGEVELALALYAPGSGELVGAARARAPLAEIGDACRESAAELLARVGAPVDALRDAPPPNLTELAASGRALAHDRAGALARAWREIDGKLSPTAVRVREAIAARARGADAPTCERARVLAASGDLAAARLLVSGPVESARPDPGCLLAAGEIQLARRNPRAARRHFEALLARDRHSADARLGLARVLALQGRNGAARRAFERAAELDADDPLPLVLHAELEVERPAERAALLLRAGRRTGRRFEARPARRLFAQAAQIDPAQEAAAWGAIGALETSLGRPRAAIDAYERALRREGDADPALWVALARAQRAAGRRPDATASLHRALALDAHQPAALLELGELLAHAGRASEAVPLLERALAAPVDADRARRALAAALRSAGHTDRALALLDDESLRDSASTEMLRALAALQLERGAHDAAREALRTALAREPLGADLHEALAEVLEASGSPIDAARERELARRLFGQEPSSAHAARFDEAVLGLATGLAEPWRLPVAPLPLRPAPGWRERLHRWLAPRTPVREALEAELDAAVARRFRAVAREPTALEALRPRIEQLAGAPMDAPPDAGAIAAVNRTLDTAAVVAAQLRLAPAADADGARCAPGEVAIELRMFAGREPELAGARAARACVEAEPFHAWNRRAVGLAALLAVALLGRFLVGWGAVSVAVALPTHARGSFGVRVSRRPDRLPLERRQGEDRRQRLRRWLRALSRYERHGVERERLFRWIPPRRRPYTVCVRGELIDAASGSVIAQVLEQRPVRVRRWHTVRITFDLRPRDAAVELPVSHDAEPVEAAETGEAAEPRAEGAESFASAELQERDGDPARAAETWRSAGELAHAARCYEAAFAYDEAIECYRACGNGEKVLELLEKTGAYLDAARLASEAGDEQRALSNLRQIGERDDDYPDGCALFAEIASERGDHELAADKIREALRTIRGERPPLALHVRAAELLELAERREEAIETWEAVRGRDPEREGVTERIERLRREAGREMPPDSSQAPSAASGRYEILGEIGRGGMGVVFRARDLRLGRFVALKRLPETLRERPGAVELFRREARAAAALNHRNIVTVFDADEDDGHFTIAMELLEGQPLGAILRRRGRITPSDAAHIGIQICKGLQYAHDKRIVHRDIKNGNLFVTRERIVKIMDFGLARTIEEVRGASTLIGGTPSHMAPEQAAGEPVDHRTDLYSLGVVLFELVAGHLPFREGELSYHHRYTPPPDPRATVPDLPDALAELILQLLAKVPDERPGSAAEVASRLQELLADRKED